MVLWDYGIQLNDNQLYIHISSGYMVYTDYDVKTVNSLKGRVINCVYINQPGECMQNTMQQALP